MTLCTWQKISAKFYFYVPNWTNTISLSAPFLKISVKIAVARPRLIPSRLNDPASGLDDKRLNPVHTVVYQSQPIWLSKILCWLVDLRINVDLVIFQPYLDLEAGDNQSLKIQVARPGIEPRSSCSASQELNHSATTAPSKFYEDFRTPVIKSHYIVITEQYANTFSPTFHILQSKMVVNLSCEI